MSARPSDAFDLDMLPCRHVYVKKRGAARRPCENPHCEGEKHALCEKSMYRCHRCARWLCRGQSCIWEWDDADPCFGKRSKPVCVVCFKWAA